MKKQLKFKIAVYICCLTAASGCATNNSHLKQEQEITLEHIAEECDMLRMHNVVLAKKFQLVVIESQCKEARYAVVAFEDDESSSLKEDAINYVMQKLTNILLELEHKHFETKFIKRFKRQVENEYFHVFIFKMNEIKALGTKVSKINE